MDDLEHADAECEDLRAYVSRYHEADKRAAVFEERLKRDIAADIFFGTTVGLGSVILGLAPTFWDGSSRGPISVAVGLALIVGGVVGRLKSK